LDGIPLAIEFAAAREPVAEHNDMVKAIPPDRTAPMPGKMARSATRPPFGLPEGAGSRPHLASVFQGRRKSNNIHASSGVIWGIPAKILPQIPLGRLGEPEEIADLIIYLCSDGAAFVTGANIAINGGQHMQ
jgi:hypothetical protein